MPVIKDLFLNDVAYASTTWVSEWTNFESTGSFTLTVYASASVNVLFEYAVDSDFQIVKTETIPLAGPELITTTRQVSTSYVRFSVINIAPPIDLKIEGYFFATPQTTTGQGGGKFTKALTINASFSVSGSGSRIYGFFAGTNANSLANGYFSSDNAYRYRYVVPADGIIKNLIANLQNSPGSGQSRTYTLNRNDVDTVMSCTMSGSESTASYLDEIAVSAGDRLYIRYSQTGSPSNPDTLISCLFVEN